VYVALVLFGLLVACVDSGSYSTQSTSCQKEDYDKAMKSLLKVLSTTRVDVTQPLADRSSCLDAAKGLLSSDPEAVVVDVGTFSGLDLVAEYVCVPTVDLVGNPAVVSYSDYDSLLVSKNELFVTVTTEFSPREFPPADLPWNPSNPVAGYYTPIISNSKLTFYQHASVTFDKKCKISSVDALTGPLIALSLIQGNALPQNQYYGLEVFCATAFQACGEWDAEDKLSGGPGLGYGTATTCVENVGAILVAQPYWQVLGSPLYQADTLSCRSNHIVMAFVDPTTHCPHVAAASTACTDTTLLIT